MCVNLTVVSNCYTEILSDLRKRKKLFKGISDIDSFHLILVTPSATCEKLWFHTYVGDLVLLTSFQMEGGCFAVGV